MAGITENGSRQGWSGWRIAGWTAVPLLLLVPLVAMQLTDEVDWTVFDFVFAGVLLIGTGVTYELAARWRGDSAYRAAVGVALAAAFLLIWVNGAVGIIGSEDNDANLMYGGVVAIGVIGALIARFQPHGMALALFATALAQALVTAVAVIGGLGEPWSGPAELLLLNGFFIAVWLTSAWLFRQAADGESV